MLPTSVRHLVSSYGNQCGRWEVWGENSSRQVIWSMLGAVVLHNGGTLVNHRWLRLLGSGSQHLPEPTTTDWLAPPSPAAAAPSSLTVTLDVLGARFATNRSGLPGQPDDVCY